MGENRQSQNLTRAPKLDLFMAVVKEDCSDRELCILLFICKLGVINILTGWRELRKLRLTDDKLENSNDL